MTRKTHAEAMKEIALLKKKAFEVSTYLEKLGFVCSKYSDLHDAMERIDKDLDVAYEEVE
jgi:hypothetical protein